MSVARRVPSRAVIITFRDTTTSYSPLMAPLSIFFTFHRNVIARCLRIKSSSYRARRCKTPSVRRNSSQQTVSSPGLLSRLESPRRIYESGCSAGFRCTPRVGATGKAVAPTLAQLGLHYAAQARLGGHPWLDAFDVRGVNLVQLRRVKEHFKMFVENLLSKVLHRFLALLRGPGSKRLGCPFRDRFTLVSTRIL